MRTVKLIFDCSLLLFYNKIIGGMTDEKTDGFNFMLGYTTSFDAVDRSIFGQYDISKHMNITYSRSYDMSRDPKDWYGLEYKISF